MLDDMDKDTLFYEYYKQWVEVYTRSHNVKVSYDSEMG